MTERTSRRGAHLTPEHQRKARANVKRESLVRAGRNGYQACVAKYGADFAAERVAAWRAANPSALEQIVAGWLDDLGQAYEREAQACPGVYPDFTLPGLRVVHADGAGWHSNGGPHGEDRETRDAWIDAKLHVLGYCALRLSEAEIRDGSGRARLEKFLES